MIIKDKNYMPQSLPNPKSFDSEIQRNFDTHSFGSNLHLSG